jgi:hypothetical protein
MREAAGDPFEVGENAVAPLVMQAIESGTEKFAVIHHTRPGTEPAGSASLLRLEPRPFLELFQV